MLAPPDKLIVLAFENHTTAMEDLLCPLLLCLTVLELESSLHVDQRGHQSRCGKFVAVVIIKERRSADGLDVS